MFRAVSWVLLFGLELILIGEGLNVCAYELEIVVLEAGSKCVLSIYMFSGSL